MSLMLSALDVVASLALMRGLLLASNDAVSVGRLGHLSLLLFDRYAVVVAIKVVRGTGPRVAHGIFEFTLGVDTVLLLDDLGMLGTLLPDAGLGRRRSGRFHFSGIGAADHILAVPKPIQQLIKAVLEHGRNATDHSCALPLVLDRRNHACDEVDLLLHLLQLAVVHRKLGSHLWLLNDRLALLLCELLQFVRHFVSLHDAVLVHQIRFFADLLML